MGYTLATTWLLLAIAAISSFVIGWFLAKKFCKCDDSALRTELNTAKIEANEHKAKVQGLVGQVDSHKADAAKLKASGSDVLKHTQRIDQLEAAASGAAVAASAATLAAKAKHAGELASLRAELDLATAKHAEAESKIQGFAATGSVAAAAAHVSVVAATDDSAKLSARIAELEAERAKNAASVAATAGVSTEQLTAGAGVLGLSTLEIDDLKVVEGIGPKIGELLVSEGVTSWYQLSEMSVEKLQGILDSAGPNFAAADPGTWARQAELLANARWAEFKTLTNELKAGLAH
jgi:predicted flap endonuclease-1-like 5' DNA nuclease